MAKVHPLTGRLSIDHTSLPPVGWMNQEYVFTESLLRHFRLYNQALADSEGSGSKIKSKGPKSKIIPFIPKK